MSKATRIPMDQDRNHHPYSADPQSGADNCRCGRTEAHRVHPHEFRRAHVPAGNPSMFSDKCVCGRPPEDEQHLRWLQNEGRS